MVSPNLKRSRRSHVDRFIFTPTKTTPVTVYYLLYFDETASYQIVAKSSIKTFHDNGFATVLVRNKRINGKISLNGTSFLY
jgi:hypothetical protein